MPSDIACCRECGSIFVTFHASYHDGAHHYWYSCDQCGRVTPDRPEDRAAAAEDVDWLPSHEVRFR